ncbi:substrate-binding periplasmic protein [Gynuella sunshinyii]|uniref:ABC-type amino acid transport/signal transduction system, periplasmic component/domain n=1 Tax=Gynuella sunshinyii YC6258 TaxID=1445510 RepID=A0A0C5VG65_9GAMM|nr:transporter substrate-binding domain-containing protein [Gynuella sunshinyii]AJQ93181.1 ABC-type amino acid transport/signal transduction system, periplasmic component/domain [Gynuella sunshinyii YC6258]
MKKIFFSLTVFVLFGFQNANSETVKVMLEPFPPLITEDGKGLSVDFLREVEKISDLKFEIMIVNYARAKSELQSGNVDLIGHTPYEMEVPEFYTYSQELKWSINSPADLYSLDAAKISEDSFRTLKRIGTPKGNEGVFSEILAIPVGQFVGGNSVESLLKMLESGRIDALLFERASVMNTMQSQSIHGVYYRNAVHIPIGFAVQKTAKGDQLKTKLESLFKQVDQDKVYEPVNKYWKLSDEGKI